MSKQQFSTEVLGYVVALLDKVREKSGIKPGRGKKTAISEIYPANRNTVTRTGTIAWFGMICDEQAERLVGRAVFALALEGRRRESGLELADSLGFKRDAGSVAYGEPVTDEAKAMAAEVLEEIGDMPFCKDLHQAEEDARKERNKPSAQATDEETGEQSDEGNGDPVPADVDPLATAMIEAGLDLEGGKLVIKDSERFLEYFEDQLAEATV